MEEKELKTSLKQRIIIGVIAVIMVGSMIASYVAIIAGGGTADSTATSEKLGEKRMEYYYNNYQDKIEALKKLTTDDFKTFSPYLDKVVAYNEAAANHDGVKVVDYMQGTGREIKGEDNDYLAYYVGWCADETIFDSSFDDASNPKAFAKVLNASVGMIEGWNDGVQGMKLGGVREITVPGELAYGEKMEICGGYNKPLKFLMMIVANEDPLRTAAQELDTAYTMLQYANYGIDYEKEMMNSDSEENSDSGSAE